MVQHGAHASFESTRYSVVELPFWERFWGVPVMMCILGLPSFFFGGCSSPKTPGDAEWTAYKARYVRAEGRVVDTSNGSVSHTEGQGYGMLLAVHYDDRQAFDEMWAWTRANLVRPDGLLSWRWRPDASGNGGKVDDANNATDGEILIA